MGGKPRHLLDRVRVEKGQHTTQPGVVLGRLWKRRNTVPKCLLHLDQTSPILGLSLLRLGSLQLFYIW
jgi:hypothetical protein